MSDLDLESNGKPIPDSDSMPGLPENITFQVVDFGFEPDGTQNVSDEDLERLVPLSRRVEQALRNTVGFVPLEELQNIGPFHVIRMLGIGGSGAVFLAKDPNLKRLVAIKTPKQQCVSDRLRARFLKEASLVAQLRHPHIIQIFQVAQTETRPYLVFEYCSAGSLRSWMNSQSEPMDPLICAEVIRAIAMATQHAHEQEILHRDINPGNILLGCPYKSTNSTYPYQFPFIPKLSDFGLGKSRGLNEAGNSIGGTETSGTLAYMAPEQFSGNSHDESPVGIDIYALGVTLYEILTGVQPFVGTERKAVIRQIQEVEPISPCEIRPDIPNNIGAICLQCLRKSPLDRFDSAGELAESLRQSLPDSFVGFAC